MLWTLKLRHALGVPVTKLNNTNVNWQASPPDRTFNIAVLLIEKKKLKKNVKNKYENK